MKNPGPSAIPKGREKAVLEPKSGVGEGCSGRGAQTRSPGGSGGRGLAIARQLDVRVPFPHVTLGPGALAPGGGCWAGKASPCGMRSPPGVVVLAQRQFVYLVAIGPHFPEAPGPNWGVSEC